MRQHAARLANARATIVSASAQNIRLSNNRRPRTAQTRISKSLHRNLAVRHNKLNVHSKRRAHRVRALTRHLTLQPPKPAHLSSSARKPLRLHALNLLQRRHKHL